MYGAEHTTKGTIYMCTLHRSLTRLAKISDQVMLHLRSGVVDWHVVFGQVPVIIEVEDWIVTTCV